jgi:hypothetical protein
VTPVQTWKIIGKVAGGIAVVAVPALLNYLSARMEASEAKIRAEVSYETMVTSVKDLQETVHALELAQARTDGEVHELGRRSRPAGFAAPAPAPEHPEEHPINQMKAPPRFEDAVNAYKAAAKK